MKIKKNDKVKILAGKDKGKIGKVLNVSLEKGKLTIEGLNLLVKHAKPRKQGEKGQRILYPAALNIAKVMLVCPKCSKAIRVGHKVLEDKKKVRYCRSCKEVID